MLREGGWGEANGDLRKYTLQRNLQWKILVWHLYSPNFSDFLQYKKSLSFFNLNHGDYKLFPLESLKDKSGADLGGECRGCARPPPPPPPEMTCGFLIQLVVCKKKTMWFISVEVEKRTSAPPAKKNPGSASANGENMNTNSAGLSQEKKLS